MGLIMSYTSLTQALVNPVAAKADKWADTNLADEADTNFADENDCLFSQGLSRAAYFSTVPLSIFTGAIDTLVGIAGGIGLFCSAFITKDVKEVRKFAATYLKDASDLLKGVHVGLVRTLNPQAVFTANGLNGHGVITIISIGLIGSVVEACRESENLFIQHVALRVAFAALIAALIVARVADVAIGLIAALFSILTGGIFDELNDIASRQLKLPIYEMFIMPAYIVNPWIGKRSQAQA